MRNIKMTVITIVILKFFNFTNKIIVIEFNIKFRIIKIEIIKIMIIRIAVNKISIFGKIDLSKLLLSKRKLLELSKLCEL